MGVQELAFVTYCDFFFEFLTFFTLRGHNFLNSIMFLMIFIAPYAQIRGIRVLLGCQKQWSPPLGFGLPWTFKCYSCNSITTQFTTNEQLKDLIHMFCLWIPYYKLYKEGLFSYIFTLKYMCHFGMNF